MAGFPGKPKYADYDRNFPKEREKAIGLTNIKFGTKIGNATLDEYTPEQLLFFARLFFNDQRITRAKLIAEFNSSTGFNEFYIQAWI